MEILQPIFKDDVLYIASDFDSIFEKDLLSFGNEYLIAESSIYRILMNKFLNLDGLNDG